MEFDTLDNSIWLFNCGLEADIPAASTGGFPESASAPVGFSWISQPLNCPCNASADIECLFVDSESLNEAGSRKRSRSEACNASGTKACREKLRRDKLNERFLELSCILEPGRPHKTDKVAILSDAIRIVAQLRSETLKLKDSNEDLQAKIKELKSEKNELRDEKQRLKADKEKLEQRIKGLRAQLGSVPHPSVVGSTFAAQGHSTSNKLMPFVGYPGFAIWQLVPPATVDTSQDHILHPPVA